MTTPKGPRSRREVVEAIDGWPERLGRRFGHGHASAAIAIVIVTAYVGLTAILACLGVLVTHVLAHGSIGHWDNHVNAYYAAHRTSFWNRASGYGTTLASTLGIVVVAVVVTGGLLLRRWGRRALLILIGLAIELSVFLSTNYLVKRPRPHVLHLGSTPSTFSWPSGHSAATFVLYGGIAVLVMSATRWLVPRFAAWLIAIVLDFGVSMSRIYRGDHHPTDAIAGVLLGIGALWMATCALRAADAAAAMRARKTEATPSEQPHHPQEVHRGAIADPPAAP
jgi:membrane-associated phospholipid phosphatase